MHRSMNCRGAALVWAVCALLILAILTTALASGALAYHSRGMRDENARQAWLTARSAADTVLAALVREATPAPGAATAEAAYAALRLAHPWLPPVEGSARLEDFTLDLAPLGGTVETLELACRSGGGVIRLSITAGAVLGGSRESLTLHAVLGQGAGQAFVWSAEDYE